MKLTVRLVAKQGGSEIMECFKLSSADGKSVQDFRALSEYIETASPFLGLHKQLAGNGTITLSADPDQLDAATVETLKKFVESALENL